MIFSVIVIEAAVAVTVTVLGAHDEPTPALEATPLSPPTGEFSEPDVKDGDEAVATFETVTTLVCVELSVLVVGPSGTMVEILETTAPFGLVA